MVVINPKDNSVLTLKPEMTITEHKKYTVVTWPGAVYDPNEIAKDTKFLINLKYDNMVEKLNSKNRFIVSQWKEI